jgi:hypothetical protein
MDGDQGRRRVEMPGQATLVSALELKFGDGEYRFDLKLPQLAELQEKCGVGVGAIRARLGAGRYLLKATGAPYGNPDEARFTAEDIYHSIRLGLIGGGGGIVDGRPVTVGGSEAKILADRYVLGRPLAEAWTVAYAVLAARVDGYAPAVEAAPPKKAKAPRRKTAGSTSPEP